MTQNTPKFQRIADALLKEIESGALPPGDKLPSERDIASTYGVALLTARRALGELESEGRVVRMHRRGTFVAPQQGGLHKPGRRLAFRYLLVGREATDPTYSVIYHHLVRAASEAGGDLICSEVPMESGRRGFRKTLQSLHLGTPIADGIIVNGDTTEEQIAEIQRLGMPVVLCYRPSTRLAEMCDWVVYDHYASAALLVEHLVGLGHRRIGVVAGDVAAGWPMYLHATVGQEVREAYCVAITQKGIELDRDLFCGVSNPIEPESGRVAARHLMSLPSPPTAMIMATDRLGVGALEYLRETGIAVPGEVSVAAIGDYAPARNAQPPMTTVGIDHGEYAREMIRLLMERIEGKRSEARGVTVDLKLVARESTGPISPARMRQSPR